MGKARLIALISLLIVRNSFATTWYAAEGGTSTNGGYWSPWSVSYAVTNASANPHLQPGDTVIFKSGGTHRCTETNGNYSVGNVLHFRRAGLPASPITYRAESLWGFTFDGGLMLSAATLSVSNINLWGLHVMSSLSTNRTMTNSAGYTLPSGIVEDGPGNSIQHCLIENTGHPGIASWKGTRGKNIRGNIIRFTGFDDWILYSGANRGSAMYLQNADDSSTALVEGNISYFNYTTGMKAYGNTDIWGFRFAHNFCAENGEAGIFFHLDNYASSNLVIATNWLWQNGSGVKIGYPLGNGGHSNAVVTWNYAIDAGHSAYPFYLADGWRNVTWSNNVGVSTSDRYVWHLEVTGETSGDVTSHHFGANSYFGTNTGAYGAGQFAIKEVSKSLAQWQTETTTDADATHTYAMPTTFVKEVFRPSTDTNFLHVVVINWPLSNSTTISLSGFGFSRGDAFNVYDAQEIPNPCSSIVWDGSSDISLDLTRTNRATMLGTFSQRTSQWSGFDPRIRAFVIYRSGNINQSNPGKMRGILLR